MSADHAPAPELVALQQDAERRGYVYGTDFVVRGVPTTASSEVVVIGREGDHYVVTYRDMGRDRERVRTRDLVAARAVFFEELERLGRPWAPAPADDVPTRGTAGAEPVTRSPREGFEEAQRGGLFAGMTGDEVEARAAAADAGAAAGEQDVAADGAAAADRPARPGDLYRLVATPERVGGAVVTSGAVSGDGTTFEGELFHALPFRVRLEDGAATGSVTTGPGQVVDLRRVEGPWAAAADAVVAQALELARTRLPGRYLGWLERRAARPRADARRGGGDLTSLDEVERLVRAEFGDAVDAPVPLVDPSFEAVRHRVHGTLDLTVGFELPRRNVVAGLTLPTGAGVSVLPGEYLWGGSNLEAVRHRLAVLHEFCRELLDLAPEPATTLHLPQAARVRAEQDLSVEQYVDAYVVPFVEDAVASGKPVTFPVDPCTVPDDGVLARQLEVLTERGLLVDRDAHADGLWHAVRPQGRAASAALEWAGWCADAMVAVLGDDVAEPRLRSASTAAEGVLLGAYVVTVGVRPGGAWARLDGFGAPSLALAAEGDDPARAVRDVLVQARDRASATLPDAYVARYRRDPRGAGTALRGYAQDPGLAGVEQALAQSLGTDWAVLGRRRDDDVEGLALGIRRRVSAHVALRGPERALARSVDVGAGRHLYSLFGGRVPLDSAPASVGRAVGELAEWVTLRVGATT
ncbi:hypothetical protein [Cellulomonas sp.]|uniref:hypothetical protein n=1 Tax=Cellulomonas sp. TaxID=40001 RepID=UPI00281238CA|nr:hypothetical protein [Cellulomonas sp.]